MFKLSKPGLAAAVLIALAGVGSAQTQTQDHDEHHQMAQATPSGRGPGMMGGAGQMGGGAGMMGGGGGMMGGYWNTGTYLESLKSQLGITASQEPAWKEYSDTVSGVGEQLHGLHQTMFESMGTASWQERRDMMNQMFQARQQALTTVHDAAAKLLTALDPSQQAKARTDLPGLGFGPGMMMGGRGPGGPSR